MAYAKAFGDTEFERRRSEVGRRMEAAGFDLLVCQDPANRRGDLGVVRRH